MVTQAGAPQAQVLRELQGTRWTSHLRGFCLGGEAGGNQEWGQVTDQETGAMRRAGSKQEEGRALDSDCGGPGQTSLGLGVVVTISNRRWRLEGSEVRGLGGHCEDSHGSVEGEIAECKSCEC